jgi:hypothetical protein
MSFEGERHPAGARIVGLALQLDFVDFAMLRGGREALMAFDIGFAILHDWPTAYWV